MANSPFYAAKEEWFTQYNDTLLLLPRRPTDPPDPPSFPCPHKDKPKWKAMTYDLEATEKTQQTHETKHNFLSP
jgi:hypothetical protein